VVFSLASFYSLKPIASELFVEKHRSRLRETFSDHHIDKKEEN